LPRVPKSALTLLVGFMLVTASACSTSAATSTPGASGGAGAAGATNAVGGTTAPGASAVIDLTDPTQIITQVLNGTSNVKSFHIALAVSGTIKAAALSSAEGGSKSGLTGDLKLDGTAVEGDVDVANSAAHLALKVPAMAAFGNIPITGDLIVVDNALYYKVSLLGTKYTKADLGSLASMSPIAIPTPGASASAAISDQVSQIRTALTKAGVTAKLVGVDKIGGKDADHISVSVPLDLINSQIAASASAAPAMKIDSLAIDFWVYTDNYRMAKAEFSESSASFGNLDITVAVTNYDQPVTITAPAASDILPSK
jgi:hypothetical protein